MSESRDPLFPSPELAGLLFWTRVITTPVAGDHGPCNDELVEVDARTLYNLLHALQAVKERIDALPPEMPHAQMWNGSRTCWCGEHHPLDGGTRATRPART